MRTLGAVVFLLTIASHNLCKASTEVTGCADTVDDMQRLNCYDKLNVPQQDGGRLLDTVYSAESKKAGEASYLSRSWDLDKIDAELMNEDLSPFRPHRVSYLIVKRTDATNEYPSSPAYPANATPVKIDQSEIKFQLSIKAKLTNTIALNSAGLRSFSLWGGYTQQSHLLSFNSGNSGPIRATNYEPEIILNFGTGSQSGLKLINFGLIHQSNGLDIGMSRNLNRAYMQGGWEYGSISTLMRGWWRVPERFADGDNRDIADYYGSVELRLRWEPEDNRQVVNVIIRNNLQFECNRGFVQVDWATPVALSKSTKLHLQFTSGYGESLIDYNFYQSTLGIGISFRDW